MTTKHLGEEGFKWFIGVVEDNKDPLELGRVRARILNEHDDVDKDELPWAQVMGPATNAAVGGIGNAPVGMMEGTTVVGFYIDGNEKQFPMIMGTLNTIPDMDDEKHSVSPLARGKQIVDKDIVGPEPKSTFAAEYPYNKTVTTQSGHIFETDDTPGAERIHVYHKSGSYVEINNKGDIIIKSTSDLYTINVGERKDHVDEGDYKIEVKSGKFTLKVDGKATIEADEVHINSDNTKITGDLRVDGNISASKVKTGR